MRKFVIAAALAASALTVATPAAAQNYQGNGYGYQGNGYGNYGDGYNNNYGQVRRLKARIDQVQHQINRLDSRDVLSEREASRLRAESRTLEYRLRRAAQYGLNGRERYEIERGIQRLEQHVWREARDGNGRRDGNYWRNDGNYRDGQWIDRDRDGRDDRTEDDRGYRHD